MKKNPIYNSNISYFEKENPIGWLLTKVSAKYEKEFFYKITQEKQFSSITLSDHKVLSFLTTDSITSNEIAKKLGVSKQAISKSIASLEERGYIVRKESRDDGRAQTLLLTEKGNKLVAKAIQVAKEIDFSTAKQIGEKDLRLVKDLLSKILQSSEGD